MPDHKIRWGVISTANIGRAAVLPAIQASRNGELVAVASRDGAKAAEFAAQLGIPRSCGAYEELLAAADIDAVYIPLPNSLHREWTVKSAEAGKHILCEKPLALNPAECAEMADAARAHNVKLMEAFMYRFHPRTAKVLELMASGVIGELRLIRAGFTFRLTNPANIRLQADLGGGSLMDVGCYCVNLSRTVAGREPLRAQALASWGATGVDEQMVGLLEFSGGLPAQFDCALTLERREFYELAGTAGSLFVPGSFLPGAADALIYERHGRAGETVHRVPGVDQYRLMVEAFADCVLADLPVPYPPDEAAANLAAMAALYRSAHNNGQPVNV